MNIVYFGTPEFGAYILEELIKSTNTQPAPRFTVQTVITRADKPVGRHQTISSSPVALVGQKYHIPVLKPLKLNEEFIQNHLSFLDCDLFIVASYGKIIPQALLDIPKLGAINVHGSILPKYRGASPIQSAILNKDKETGVTTVLMDDQMDHGPVLFTKKISISDKDTYSTLSTKILQVAAPLLIDTLTKFVEGNVTPKQQNHDLATFCSLLKKDSGYFDINNPPSLENLDRMIRAYYPWPGVWTRFRASSADRVPHKASAVTQVAAKAEQGSSGQECIVKLLPEGKIQMEGKKVMGLKDFLNGYPDFPLKF